MRRISSVVLFVLLCGAILIQEVPAQDKPEQEGQVSTTADSSQGALGQTAETQLEKEERLEKAIEYQKAKNTVHFIEKIHALFLVKGKDDFTI